MRSAQIARKIIVNDQLIKMADDMEARIEKAEAEVSSHRNGCENAVIRRAGLHGKNSIEILLINCRQWRSRFF